MSDMLTVSTISDIRQRIHVKLQAIYYALLFIIVMCMLVFTWLITICLYLMLYMVLTPIVLIKLIFNPRT